MMGNFSRFRVVPERTTAEKNSQMMEVRGYDQGPVFQNNLGQNDLSDIVLVFQNFSTSHHNDPDMTRSGFPSLVPPPTKNRAGYVLKGGSGSTAFTSKCNE